MVDLSSVVDATIALLGVIAILMVGIGSLGIAGLTQQVVSVAKPASVKAKDHLVVSKAA
ncbi:MAG: hypothetical protein ACREI2_05680 [Nitrospiraceae bacterium]